MSLAGNIAVEAYCKKIQKIIDDGQNWGWTNEEILDNIKSVIRADRKAAEKGWY